jgi:hypothetical protein
MKERDGKNQVENENYFLMMCANNALTRSYYGKKKLPRQSIKRSGSELFQGPTQVG